MATPTAPNSSSDRVAKVYAGYSGLYAPSVIEEASRFLDDLLTTAERHGHDRASSDLGWLVTAAAEATARKYGRPAVDRTSAELSAHQRALSAAFTAQGLSVTSARVRMGVAVEPVAGGPVWGMDGRTGLAVAVYADSGWELMVNQPQGRVFSIHAPVTDTGAGEVAVIVRGLLHGEVRDPFRR